MYAISFMYVCQIVDGQIGEDGPSRSDDSEFWKGALQDVEDDLKRLFQPRDLNYFRDVLTQEEMSELNSLDVGEDQLVSKVFERVKVKTHSLLRKIPECLRNAGNDSLAMKLEDAYRKRVRSSGETWEASTSIEVARGNEEEKPTFLPTGNLSSQPSNATRGI